VVEHAAAMNAAATRLPVRTSLEFICDSPFESNYERRYTARRRNLWARIGNGEGYEHSMSVVQRVSRGGGAGIVAT
jgi:hypothetical protein